MTAGYRVATDVPWDSGRGPDWGKLFTSEKNARDAAVARARNNKGEGYRVRETKDDWGPKKGLPQLESVLAGKMEKGFHIGDVLIIWALKNDVKVMLRKVDAPDPDVSMDTSGDDDVDWNHGLIFRDPSFQSVESWGIRNDRFIAGTSSPSMHWGRGPLCTARAEDFGGASSDTLWKVARKLAGGNHCGKILYSGHEWLPGWGSFRFVGSYIGHYDHVHAESRDSSGSLC